MSDFIKDCLAGTARFSDIDTYVERWHQCNSDKAIHDFLGLTLHEYSLWVENPEVLSEIVSARHTGANIDDSLQRSGKTHISPEILPDMGSVLGIDVGWSAKRKTSSVCRLSWNEQEIKWDIRRFLAKSPDREEAIECVAGEDELLAVAIDGPLCRGFVEIGEYRSAERILSKGHLPKCIGKPGQSNSPNGKRLNEQANISANLVKQHCRISESGHATRIDEKAIVEAFPTTFLGVMIDAPIALNSPGKKSDRYFNYLAEHGGFKWVRELLGGQKSWERMFCEVKNHDDRAALVCALTALCVAAGQFTAVGDDNYGWIILPPYRQFAPWAQKAIVKTATADCIGALKLS